MIILALALLGFAVADLLRWSPDWVSTRRAIAAATGATILTTALAAASGFGTLAVAVTATVTECVLLVWQFFDRPIAAGRKAGYPLALVLAVLVAAFATSGLADGVAGPFDRWYSGMHFSFVRSVPVDQFLLGLSAALFLLASANRVVRLVLEAAGTPAATGEETLSGGRLLGPMERLVVASMILAGELTGASIVIAAKGLLRLPEIRSSTQESEGEDDQVTEYFLIGTFSSLLLAGGLAATVLAAG